MICGSERNTRSAMCRRRIKLTNPSRSTLRLRIALLILFATTTTSSVPAQSESLSATDQAIALVQQDKLPEATQLLTALVKRNKKDVRAWHWLGTALEKQGKVGDAVKAHEQAAKVAD